MRFSLPFFFGLAFFSSCQNPRHFIQKGDFDKAIDLYGAELKTQEVEHKKNRDLLGLEYSFALAQSRDSAEWSRLLDPHLESNWPRINTLQRQIQRRQQKVVALLPLRSERGYEPTFSLFENIDSLQNSSREKAANFLYAYAQALLAFTDSTGQRFPAREAYFTLCDLKNNYSQSGENTNALLDSAYQEGKAHILFEAITSEDPSDGGTFWESIAINPTFVKSEWLTFYPNSAAREEFDYHLRCNLVSLYVGSDCTSATERTESKEVEDGYDEVSDTSGHVVSRSTRYKTETTIITTYHNSRSAYGTVLVELKDLHTGQLILSKPVNGSYSFDESSEIFAPFSPTYWGMIQRVADDVAWQLRGELKHALLPK